MPRYSTQPLTDPRFLVDNMSTELNMKPAVFASIK